MTAAGKPDLNQPKERRNKMGLYKRGKVWWMAISHQGKQIRRPTGTANRKLAEAILAKVTVKMIEGCFFDTLEEKDRTFEEMMDRYLKEHMVKKASRESYIYYLKNLRSFFGQRTLNEISAKLIVRYKTERYDQGASPATINRELGAMKAAFNLAIREWEWCRSNPVSKVAMEKENNRRDRWLTDEEEERLISLSPVWLREIVVFALHTGMRRGEILSLTRKGVDLFRKTITVFRSKNGERKTIPINQTVFDLLRGKAKVRPIGTDLVFHSKVYTPINKDNLRRSFNLAITNARIEDFHFHDLRHTFATRLVQSGVDLYKVQRLLGHKSPAMTQRYAHHCPESLHDGVGILDSRKDLSQIYHNSIKIAGNAGGGNNISH